MLRRELLSSAGLGVLAVALDSGEALAATRSESITLLHGNDVYEIGPIKGQGGFAPFMTLLAQERARSPNTITTFGGDLLSPSILSGMTKGAQMIELIDALGVDIAVLGNHEFDFGPAIAEERIRAARCPWLGTNVLAADGRPAVGTVELAAARGRRLQAGLLGPADARDRDPVAARADDPLRRRRAPPPRPRSSGCGRWVPRS